MIFVFCGVSPASGSCATWWLWPKPWRWKLTGWCWQPAAPISVPCLQVLLLTPDSAWAAIAVPSPEAVSVRSCSTGRKGVWERRGTDGSAVCCAWWVMLGILDQFLWGEWIACGALWGYCGVWLTALWVRFFFSPNKTLDHENIIIKHVLCALNVRGAHQRSCWHRSCSFKAQSCRYWFGSHRCLISHGTFFCCLK